MDKFCERQTFKAHSKIDNLNSSIYILKFGLAIINLPTKKSPGPDEYIGNSNHLWKK